MLIMMLKQRSAFFGLAGVVAMMAMAAGAAELFVAPGGNDRNPGTQAQPLATLAAARDLVRLQIANGMQEDITVLIGPGDYFVENPLELDDRDAGSDGHTITYQGAPQLATRIYGGRRLTHWSKADGNK